MEEEENDGVVFLRGQNRIRGENDGQIDKIWHKGVKTQMKNMWLNVRLPSEERKRQRDGETGVRSGLTVKTNSSKCSPGRNRNEMKENKIELHLLDQSVKNIPVQ